MTKTNETIYATRRDELFAAVWHVLETYANREQMVRDSLKGKDEGRVSEPMILAMLSVGMGT
jgi:hypothetical protein